MRALGNARHRRATTDFEPVRTAMVSDITNTADKPAECPQRPVGTLSVLADAIHTRTKNDPDYFGVVCF